MELVVYVPAEDSICVIAATADKKVLKSESGTEVVLKIEGITIGSSDGMFGQLIWLGVL